jgi:hypothetical protein
LYKDTITYGLLFQGGGDGKGMITDMQMYRDKVSRMYDGEVKMVWKRIHELFPLRSADRKG